MLGAVFFGLLTANLFDKLTVRRTARGHSNLGKRWRLTQEKATKIFYISNIS